MDVLADCAWAGPLRNVIRLAASAVPSQVNVRFALKKATSLNLAHSQFGSLMMGHSIQPTPISGIKAGRISKPSGLIQDGERSVYQTWRGALSARVRCNIPHERQRRSTPEKAHIVQPVEKVNGGPDTSRILGNFAEQSAQNVTLLTRNLRFVHCNGILLQCEGVTACRPPHTPSRAFPP